MAFMQIAFCNLKCFLSGVEIPDFLSRSNTRKPITGDINHGIHPSLKLDLRGWLSFSASENTNSLEWFPIGWGQNGVKDRLNVESVGELDLPIHAHRIGQEAG
tara:strand:- start:105 stop:413 length:309 start_codon:yes stop_codon:yes gene_type:complete